MNDEPEKPSDLASPTPSVISPTPVNVAEITEPATPISNVAPTVGGVQAAQPPVVLPSSAPIPVAPSLKINPPDPIPSVIVEAPTKNGFNPAKIIIAFVALLIALGLLFGGYTVGKMSVKPKQQEASAATTTDFSVPAGATIIAQCAKGRGTQYVLPKDIPQGPVYNVYEGKVIGIEYMLGKDDLLKSDKNYLNLPLSAQQYDHVNVGLLSQGHAGFPDPHYHVDMMMVPTSVTDKITCN